MLLDAGEKVPADGELLESAKLGVDEAILTGEASRSTRAEGSRAQPALFMGTTVVTGRGLMRVTQTGPHTELGQIATSLQEHVEEETPLQVRLKTFSQTLTRIVLALHPGHPVTGLLTGRASWRCCAPRSSWPSPPSPKGLLIAVTVILVLGMRKILKRNGLVKRLLAVETLGSVTVICTDKTGTLTEGRMRVTHEPTPRPPSARCEAMVLCNDLEGPVDIALWEYARPLNWAATRRSWSIAHSGWRRSFSPARPST